VLSDVGVQSLQGKTVYRFGFINLTESSAIIFAIVLLLGFSAGGYLSARIASGLAARTVQSLRENMVDSFFGADWTVQSQERLGNLQQLLSYNVEQIGLSITDLTNAFQSGLMLCTLILTSFFINPLEALVIAIVLVSLVLVLQPISRRARSVTKGLATRNRNFATQATEFSRLAMEFRIFGVTDAAIEDLHQVNVTSSRTYRRSRFLNQLTPVLYQSLVLAFITTGFALLVSIHTSNLGSNVAILLLMLRSMLYGSSFQATTLAVQAAQSYIEPVVDALLLFRGHEIKPASKRGAESYDIVLDHLTYAYEGRAAVLHNLTLEIPSGSSVAVVGPSGSGKTTLSRLLLGLIVPDEGTIKIGGVAPSDLVTSNSLSPFSFVAQEPILMQGTIAENISFFRNIKQEAIEDAARSAHFHEDITRLPLAYDSLVGEGGGEISGGQRQRLAIARALAGDSQILVMDEPTSAIDNNSEALIRQTLRELNGRLTCFVISHRLTLVDDCDFLLILDGKGQYFYGPRTVAMATTMYKNVVSEAD
jgi:ABC-type multidrug transport system fused ATPase/permease subunit